MKSHILHTAIRYLLPLLLLFSIFLLLRGHSEPGGGFVGGLVAASAFTLYAISISVEEARRRLRANPIQLISIGLALALGSGIYGLLIGKSFLYGAWGKQYFPVFGAVGTPLFFDIGVYFTVIGVTLLIVFSLKEEN